MKAPVDASTGVKREEKALIRVLRDSRKNRERNV